MYFKLEPKCDKKEFFNYNSEYEELRKAVRLGERVIAVIGVRRVGKTSLLNIIYNEITDLKLWLDGRIVSNPKKEVFSAIYEVAKEGKSKIFGKIESLNVSAFGFGMEIQISKQSIQEMERKIRAAGPIKIFIDEAQRMDAKELADIMSYFYDRITNVSFILSGSELGLIEDILGETDAEHPLFGRHIVKIRMERLDKNRAADFLAEGFSQAKTSIGQDEVNDVINELDGLIGWLTLFGHERVNMRNKNALDKTIETAKSIAASELVHFLKKTRNRKIYLSILHNAHVVGWKELRILCGRELGRIPNQSVFSFALERLTKYSFVEKKDAKYQVADPLIFKASTEIS